MTRYEHSTFLVRPAMKRGAPDDAPSCLPCGARIGRGEPTIKIRGGLVHLHCAVDRRVARR
jgi:hypothetical protein